MWKFQEHKILVKYFSSIIAGKEPMTDLFSNIFTQMTLIQNLYLNFDANISIPIPLPHSAPIPNIIFATICPILFHQYLYSNMFTQISLPHYIYCINFTPNIFTPTPSSPQNSLDVSLETNP